MTEPLHVLAMIDSLLPGGAEHSLAALAPEYRARGVRLDVAYLKALPGLHETLERAGSGLYSLAGPGGRLGWLGRARRLIRSLQPDVVHTTLFDSNVVGRTAARTMGVPVVTSLVSDNYGDDHFSNPLLKSWKVRACQAVDIATCRFATRFHANAAHVAESMSARLKIPRDRIDVIHRGRDVATLGSRSEERRARTRASLGVGSDRFLIIAAGRHDHQKGHDMLIQAFARMKARPDRPLLIIAGREGNQTAALRRLIDQAGIADDVRLLGYRDDVPDLLCAADLFVLSSRREGFPGVVLEAMALECPIVTTDVPGALEALGTNGTGTVVPREDPVALAQAVEDIRSSPERRREQAGDAARRFHSRFAIGAVADEMVAFYHRALASVIRRNRRAAA